MRAVRIPVALPTGKPSGSYDLCWVILNPGDFYAKAIRHISGEAAASVDLYHHFCRPVDKEDIDPGETTLPSG